MHHISRHITHHLARLAVVLVLGATTLAQGGAQQTAPNPTVEALMGRALYQEEVEGRLDAAIATYRQVLATAGVRRAVAATAQFRIGVCYQRLGRTEAKQAYEAVVRSYSDQSDVVKLAQARLTALAAAAAGGTAPVMRKVASGEGIFRGRSLISPDGRLTAFSAVWGENGQIGIRDLASGDTRHLPVGDCELDNYAWSPDARTVFFDCMPRGTRQTQLRMMGLADTTSRVLLSTDNYISGFDVFPNSQSVLVFVETPNKSTDVLSIDLRTVTARTLRTAPESATHPKVSPDGQFVAFGARNAAKNQPGNYDVLVMALAGGEPQPVMATTNREELVGWTPAADGLVAYSDRGGSFGLWVAPTRNGQANGDARRVPVDVSDFDRLGAAITRDGVLFATKRASLSRLYLATVDAAAGRLSGTPQELLTTYRDNNSEPQWSPDGKTLAFMTYVGTLAGPLPRIGLLAVDSNRTTEHALEARPGRLHWSADSTYVYYGGAQSSLDSQPAYYRLNVRTGETTRVPGTSGITSAGAIFSRDWRRAIYSVRGKGFLVRDLDTGSERTIYQTANSVVLGFDLSPDERWIAVHASAGPTGSSISVISLDGATAPREIYRSAPNTPTLTYVYWSSDGRAVQCIVIKSRVRPVVNQLATLPIDGSTATYIDIGALSPYGGFSVHPDGKRVVFHSRLQEPPVVWAIENFLSPPGARTPVR